MAFTSSEDGIFHFLPPQIFANNNRTSIKKILILKPRAIKILRGKNSISDMPQTWNLHILG